jgi:hypothetical protein
MEKVFHWIDKNYNTLTKYDMLRDCNALILLMFTISKIRTNDGMEMHNGCGIYLNSNQMFMYNYAAIGLTEKKYRNAKKRLVKNGLISTKSTNKGTIITLNKNIA